MKKSLAFRFCSTLDLCIPKNYNFGRFFYLNSYFPGNFGIIKGMVLLIYKIL